MEIVAFIANIVETISGIAGIVVLYIGWSQRDKISTVFSILLKYSLQASLSDLKHHLEKLGECDINENDESKAVRKTLAYILGKIKGNPVLYGHFGEKMLKRIKIIIQDLNEGKPVSETIKISLCSEIKESLTTLELDNQDVKKYE